MKMVDRRAHNPGDLIKYYHDLIGEERRKIEECLTNISEYSARLKEVTDDTARRLIARS